MKGFVKRSPVTFLLAFLLVLAGTVPAAAAPVEKDTAVGDEDSYAYGAAADEVMMSVATATGDVNGDGIADLVVGHDWGGTVPPYSYTGKVYVYYGRSHLDPDIDLGSDADVTIKGYDASFAGNDVACGDVDGNGIDDIVIGAFLDSNVAGSAGAVAVIFGKASLPATWDFNTTPPDLYLSSAAAGEMCGMSVAAGDLDGDGCDDIVFGAPLANGSVRFGDGSSWTAQPDAGADTLYDVSLHGTSGGWAVGKYVSAYTTLYRYDGTKWYCEDKGYANVNKSFYGVSSYSATCAWAVGDGDTIIKWDGTSWKAQTSGTTTTLRDVSAVDETHAWAVGDGGKILRTTDGSSWSSQASGVTATLRGVSAVDATHAWAVGDGGTIIKWNGSSWKAQTSGVTTTLRGVSAVDGTHAWAVGDGGKILRTTNGSSWSAQASGVTTALRGVSAVDATHAWAVGDGGVILKTGDGGNTWTQDAVPFTQGLNGVDALDATHVWAVGETATGRAYAVWGRTGGWPPSDGSHPMPPDLIINGIDPFDYCGVPVSAGDLDSDGRDDLVIGSCEASGPGNACASCGEAYVVRGRSRASFSNPLNLRTQADCTIYGASAGDKFPTSVATPLEDLNGDGRDDLVFGDIFADGPGDSRGGCGEVSAIYGGSLPKTFDLAKRAPDVLVYGPAAGTLGAGRDVSVLDFDADGIQDLATSAPNAAKGTEKPLPNCGIVWLVRGASPWPASVDLATGAGMVFHGAEKDDNFGFCLSSANLDGDPGGFEDLVISDLNGEGPDNARAHCGEHFVFLGYDFAPPNCSIANVADGSVLAGEVGVEVEAADFYGINRVEFRVNGTLRHTDTSAPYRWDWDTRKDADGATYRLEATAYDAHGNSASDAREVKLNNTIPPASRTWYLAEGTTAWGFEEYVLVQNPGADPANVTYTFMMPGGETRSALFTVAGNSRFSILVNSFVDSSDVSTKVEATRPVICERAMYHTPPGDARRAMGHDSVGVTEPSPTWYLAEGTTAWGFEEYVLVQNPGADAVKVTMTFMKPGGAIQTFEFPMAGQSRFTVNVNQVVQESDVSTRVDATGPVICERAMYRYGKALGHDSIGTPSPSRQWYLAEGTTAWGFDEWVLVQNPGQEQAAVAVQFMLPDGTVVPYGIVVPGQSRYSIHVNGLKGCESTDLSTFISSSVPVICERAMYWQGATSPGGHDTIGTPLPSTRWYLAEGTTAWGFEEYVLVQNPNPDPAVVSFTFMKPDATTEFVSFRLAGNSRFSLCANDVVPESDVSVSVLSDKPVICERAMYWGDRDLGTSTIGIRGE